jgi:benzoate 4-monooxygenase
MMEMAKTIATIFRLFRFDRETEEPSETREGFIVKIAECRVRISLRD